jgi:hypothetical protein
MIKRRDERAESEIIAVFGDAQIVKHLNGALQLRGGSVEDQRAAREWADKFMPGIVAGLPKQVGGS